ncbi:MAG: protein kinase, partial [Candidatus Eisenbacteria bacterium]|nr:protein kinase [Candidatus Eisenbacteria bacterium]
MTTPQEEALTGSAAKIADGEAVDWKHEADASPGLEPQIEGLARVARIADAWRGLGVTPEDDDAADAGGEPALFLWGELEAREKLGEGAFGEVFRAWDPTLQREVALKLRRDAGDGDSARAELAEARQLARVRHPHVLEIYGVDVRGGRAGLWTELVQGRTLEQELRARGRMSADEAALIGLDLCRALAAMHAAGLAHGDLKASNVMREDGGRIVLMDFGSAREIVSDGGAGAAGGALAARTSTPLSAAPEVLAGDPATAHSDLYALGVLLYRLATGQYPVNAASLAELRDKLARGERTALRTARPDLPTPFVTAVERAIELEPGNRWADAAAFERALALTLELAAPLAVPERVVAGAREKSRRGSGTPAMIAVLVFAVMALLYSQGVLWPRREAQLPPAAAPPVAAQPEQVSAPVTAAPQVEAAAPAEQAAVPFAQATLWRSRGGERAALVDGSHVAPGDHLFLEFEGAEALHVYVLDEDEQGETFTLFPVAGAELANPLAPSQRHRLPGERAGAPFDWVVTSAGGREHVLIVASRRRIAALDKLVAATEPAADSRQVAYAPVTDEAFTALRGIGGMAPSAPA